MLEKVIVMMLGSDMETLAESLHALGSRHVEYGVHPAHYLVVETALLRTLGGALGDHWTEEVRKGWAAVFKFISKAMMSGAGAELQIIKDRRRKLERNKSATIRLKIIGSSYGVSRLSRSGMGSKSQPLAKSEPLIRASSDGDMRYLSRTNSPELSKKQSDPPKKPSRRRSQEKCAIARSTEPASFPEDETLTSEDTPNRSTSCNSLYSESSTDIPPPKVIVIFCTPSTEDDGNQASSAPLGRSNSGDVAPKMPRRPSENDMVVCTTVKETTGMDGTDETVESTATSEDDDYYVARGNACWREERVKLVYEV